MTGGFSFTDREVGRTWDNNGAGERWVWFSFQRSARLWTPQRGDVLAVKPNGSMNIQGHLGVGGYDADSVPAGLAGGVQAWDLIYHGGMYKASTIKAKEQVQPISGVLNRISRLNPVRFDRRKEDGLQKNCLGFIAEEVREIFPECVAEITADGSSFFAWGINESALHALSIAGIQELSRKLQVLRNGLSVSRAGNIAIGADRPLPDKKLYVAGDIRLDCTTADTASAGAAALPERPAGFIVVNIHGHDYKLPFYGD